MGDLVIKIREIEIGRITAAGRYLDKVAFLGLCTTERVAAYLALVYPAIRSAGTIQRVCGLRRADVAGYCREMLRIGTIRRMGHGHYVLGREEIAS